jgi:hypothetical protein
LRESMSVGSTELIRCGGAGAPPPERAVARPQVGL